jgi:tetratricopeptide (TPR) repeat protein
MIIRLNLNDFFESIRLGKYQEAIDAYKKAIKIKSDYHHAYTNLFELQLIQKPHDNQA